MKRFFLFLLILFSVQSVCAQSTYQNLALNRMAISSSNIDHFLCGHLVTDGSLDTRWESANTSVVHPEWLYVDLGEVYPIDQVIIHWEQAYPYHYQIQTAVEAPNNWRTVFGTDHGAGEIDTIKFDQHHARYVRMLSTYKNTLLGVSIWEMQVWGDKKSTNTSIYHNAIYMFLCSVLKLLDTNNIIY